MTASSLQAASALSDEDESALRGSPPSDPSCRFILPADAPLPKNLAALWAVDAALAAQVEGAAASQAFDAADASLFTPENKGVAAHQIEASRSGKPTVRITLESGRAMYLHSRYDPAQEASRLVDSINIEGVGFHYVFGLGLGYHLQALLERCGQGVRVCVFEPDVAVIRLAMEHHDFSTILEEGRLLLVVNLDRPAFFARLTPLMSIITIGTASIEHAASLEAHAQFFAVVKTWVDEFAAYSRTAMNTLVLNGRKTAENIARNLKWYVSAPGLGRLHERYKGRPGIIISAGPSLRKNKHLLKQAGEGAALIAVQTMLQPLLEMGVEPHFVTSLDYHEICARFFEKLPATLRTELVAEPKATELVFKLNPGPLTILGNEFADGMLAELDLRKPRLLAGATVAHLAYYLAEFLGCDPIIFVGQDLGFSDGLAYTPGTSHEDVWRPELSRFCTIEMKQWEQIVRDRPILRQIPDYQGRPMYTEERLFVYLQQFERDFAQSKARIIDATEGGALKRGAIAMPLAEAMRRFCAEPLPAEAEDHPGLRHDLLVPARRSLDRRREESEKIEQISQETLPLLEEIRDHLDDQSRVNRAIGRIDTLRNRMNTLGNCYGLIMQLTQCTEMQRFTADQEIAASKVNGIEKQRRQVVRDIANVRSVIDAAREFRSLVEQVAADLNREIAARNPQQEAA